MLTIIKQIFKILPNFFLSFLYDLIKPFSGKIAYGLRYILVASLCEKVGSKVIIGCNVTFKHWNNITIGSNVSIHECSYLDGYGKIVIGNDVSIAHHCSIISSTHTWDNTSIPIRQNPIQKKPVTLNNNIWIGCGSRILGPSIIEENCIIGANSLVISSLHNNGVYVGSPVRFIKPVYTI